jgi:hypothetical protein
MQEHLNSPITSRINNSIFGVPFQSKQARDEDDYLTLRLDSSLNNPKK